MVAATPHKAVDESGALAFFLLPTTQESVDSEEVRDCLEMYVCARLRRDMARLNMRGSRILEVVGNSGGGEI